MALIYSSLLFNFIHTASHIPQLKGKALLMNGSELPSTTIFHCVVLFTYICTFLSVLTEISAWCCKARVHRSRRHVKMNHMNGFNKAQQLNYIDSHFTNQGEGGRHLI